MTAKTAYLSTVNGYGYCIMAYNHKKHLHPHSASQTVCHNDQDSPQICNKRAMKVPLKDFILKMMAQKAALFC